MFTNKDKTPYTGKRALSWPNSVEHIHVTERTSAEALLRAVRIDPRGLHAAWFMNQISKLSSGMVAGDMSNLVFNLTTKKACDSYTATDDDIVCAIIARESYANGTEMDIWVGAKRDVLSEVYGDALHHRKVADIWDGLQKQLAKKPQRHPKNAAGAPRPQTLVSQMSMAIGQTEKTLRQGDKAMQEITK